MTCFAFHNGIHGVLLSSGTTMFRRRTPPPSVTRPSDDEETDDEDVEEWVAMPDGTFKRADLVAALMTQVPPISTADHCDAALQCYARTWALYVFVPALDAAISGAQGAVDSRPLGYGDAMLLPLALYVSVHPTPTWLAVAHAVKLLLFVGRLPFVWDHEWWATLNEAALVVAVLAQKQQGAARAFFRGARHQLIVLYTSAAFWKLNTSFLNPSTSCATVILTQQLAAYAPPSLAHAAAPMVAAAAPWLAVAVEALIPILLRLAPRAGVALATLFHALVLLTPAPNYAGGFSVSCVARLLLALPPAQARHVELLTPWPAAAAALAAAAVPSATFAAFFALATAHLGALARRAGAPNPATHAAATARGDCGRVHTARYARAATALTAGYAFMLPVLGLMHMGSSSMYANLKHWGGSNHLLVPTGLLQEWAATGAAEAGLDGGWLGELFGGGLVRVEAVRGASLSSLNAWATVEPAPLAPELLQSVGHSGRQLAAYYAPGRMASLDAAGHAVTEAALPAAMPAFEVRRALAAARAAGVPAEADVTRLPAALRTPAEWLAFRGRLLTVRSDGTCVVRGTATGRFWERGHRASECDHDEASLARPPPWALAKLLLPYPAPLLPGDDVEIHCSA